MFNFSENAVVISIVSIALAILIWGYNRARSYGKLGMLAWLQSVVLMTPWLLFFALFAAGIYINLLGIIFLLVASAVVYIYLGNRLRALGQAEMSRQREGRQQKAQLQPLNLLTESENQETETGGEGESEAEKSAGVINGKPEVKIEQSRLPDIIPINDGDLKIIKGIFGIDTFFATETIPYQEGAIFKGNLRGDADIVHQQLTAKLQENLGEKYRLFLVETPEEKPVVIVLPSSNDPQPTTLPQKNLALVLLLATIFTTLEALGLLLGFDLVAAPSRYQEAVPLTLGLWAILIAHEIGHYLAAKSYNLRLSVPFFLPTVQIGSFGAITRFESLLPHRSALFDVAIAGPGAGGIVSLLMLVVGLTLSHPGSAFQIPTAFFQGSVLVGTLAKIILGTALESGLVDVHPLTVLGWLGLVINALNLLPAGQLDGGRIVQAIYGRKIARRTTIGTLVLLGIVSLLNPVNSVPLYWAIVILFLQRDLERPSLNELTEPDDNRATWGLLALFLTLTVLIPLSPSLAGRLGIGM